MVSRYPGEYAVPSSVRIGNFAQYRTSSYKDSILYLSSSTLSVFRENGSHIYPTVAVGNSDLFTLTIVLEDVLLGIANQIFAICQEWEWL
jgi:hypothetical protein